MTVTGASTRCLRFKYNLSSGGKLLVRLNQRKGTVWATKKTPAGYQSAEVELTDIDKRTKVSP